MDEQLVDHLKGAGESFHKVVDFGLRVSLELNGKPATDQSALASIVHTKMCVNGASIEHMLKAPLTDHSVIISLCRMIMEASILYQYLMENVGTEEWNCRRVLLGLHDTTNRIKLMRGFPGTIEHLDMRQGRDELRTELNENTFFKSLPPERATSLLSGEHFYIRGVGSAVKSARWNSEKYMALHSYFSSHAHSAPMSFFRVRKHKTSFSDPSEAQCAAMVSALSVAEYSLLKSSLTQLATTPECRTKFNIQELEEMERTLVGWKAHFETTE